MKKLLCVLLTALVCTSAFAQRPVKLTVLDNKGREMKNKDIVVYIKGTHPTVHTLNSSGELTVKDIMNSDTLSVIIRHEMYEFPMNGVNDLTLKINRRGEVIDAMRNGHEMVNTGYNMMPASRNPYNVKVTKNSDNNPTQYLSLADYLQGRIAGLVIEGGPGYYQAYLNGSVPLTVVDGLRMRSFNEANNLVNPGDIASVTIDYNGALYGAAGLNGVILVTLKR